MNIKEKMSFIIKTEAQALVLTGADGFHETVVMQDMLDPRTLLVYGMNGETLPVDHGFPHRYRDAVDHAVPDEVSVTSRKAE